MPSIALYFIIDRYYTYFRPLFCNSHGTTDPVHCSSWPKLLRAQGDPLHRPTSLLPWTCCLFVPPFYFHNKRNIVALVLSRRPSSKWYCQCNVTDNDITSVCYFPFNLMPVLSGHLRKEPNSFKPLIAVKKSPARFPWTVPTSRLHIEWLVAIGFVPAYSLYRSL